MILLEDIWEIENVENYKVHFARYNDTTQPLDDWVRNRQIWRRWQEYRPKRAGFNRRFIFSLMQFYHETDSWLFGGVFEVLDTLEKRYEITLTEQGENFIGRLKLRSSYDARTARVNFEKHYGPNAVHILKVQEILREPYSGRSFPGYGNIHLSFAELEMIIRNDRPDWRAALASVKGIYLIIDGNTNKQYVGAAHGEMGIWQRWNEYVDTGHGNNVELQNLVEQNGIDYCLTHFQFALLEQRQAHTSDDEIRAREQWWKNVLRTRKVGLNRN